MHPTKALGPDGLSALFYQMFWYIIGDDVSNQVLHVLNDGLSLKEVNHTFLCLIPKVKKPRHTKEFRPIFLCNVIFKLVTKTIANRLKIILPYIVSPYQSAFVPGHLITNNALIAFEIFHFMRKKKDRENRYSKFEAGHGQSL